MIFFSQIVTCLTVGTVIGIEIMGAIVNMHLENRIASFINFIIVLMIAIRLITTEIIFFIASKIKKSIMIFTFGALYHENRFSSVLVIKRRGF